MMLGGHRRASFWNPTPESKVLSSSQTFGIQIGEQSGLRLGRAIPPQTGLFSSRRRTWRHHASIVCAFSGLVLGPSLSRGRRGCASDTKKEKWQRIKRDGEEETSVYDIGSYNHLLKKQRYVKGADIDRAGFTRVYDIAALRVPSDESEKLAYQLRGHLLNWPRIKNLARVAGDEVDENLEGLFWDGERKEETVSESVRKAVFEDDDDVGNEAGLRTGVVRLRRKKEERFPHLEELSKPRGAARSFIYSKKDSEEKLQNEKSNMVEARGISRSMWEEKAVVVEVVDDGWGVEKDHGAIGDFLGLLEQGKQSRRFQGSTRLLLLDEGLAGKALGGLPMALQVAVSAGNKRGFTTRQLVQTRLVLSYDYWAVDEILQDLLPVGMAVPTTFDKLGHIARLHLQDEHYAFRHVIAQVILDRHKPRIRSVVCDVDAQKTPYVGQELELLAGNSRLATTIVQNGLPYRIDLTNRSWPKIGPARQSYQAHQRCKALEISSSSSSYEGKQRRLAQKKGAKIHVTSVKSGESKTSRARMQ